MNGEEMLRLIDAISRDRNVDKDVLCRDIEQAMVSAARKHFNAVDTEEFTSTLDRLTGKIQLWRGEQEISLESLGRIPAQTAKQVMIQRFREDERASIFSEFVDRVGELTTGAAQRYEGGSLVVSIGRAEGFMPRSEQIPGEQHQPGDRVRCIILDVRETGNQVKIVLSRGSPDFIRRLFEVEVPEVAERIIEVKAMAREPGHRTKIAVSSIDSKVDAVGACVGVHGSRIKNIVDELGGEKIDIVRWNESSQVLIQNALKPAEVVEINLCFELGRATVVVNEDQLSLAIGKRGQNVRLAARLTNWDVDILTPAEFTKGLDIMEETLKQVEGISEEQIDRLAALGVISVLDIEEVGVDYLVESLECTKEQAQQAVEVSAERAKRLAQDQAREKEETEQRKKEEEAALAAQPGEQQAAAVLGDIFGDQDQPTTDGQTSEPGDAETVTSTDALAAAVLDDSQTHGDADLIDHPNTGVTADSTQSSQEQDPAQQPGLSADDDDHDHGPDVEDPQVTIVQEKTAEGHPVADSIAATDDPHTQSAVDPDHPTHQN